MARAKNNYYKTLKKEDRAAAAWALGQLEISIARKVSGAVKAKVPGWAHGDPIPSDVLDEIFADEGITSMVTEKSGTAGGLQPAVYAIGKGQVYANRHYGFRPWVAVSAFWGNFT